MGVYAESNTIIFSPRHKLLHKFSRVSIYSVLYREMHQVSDFLKMFCHMICRGCRGLMGTFGPATGIATSALRAVYSLPVSLRRRRRKRRSRPPFKI